MYNTHPQTLEIGDNVSFDDVEHARNMSYDSATSEVAATESGYYSFNFMAPSEVTGMVILWANPVTFDNNVINLGGIMERTITGIIPLMAGAKFYILKATNAGPQQTVGNIQKNPSFVMFEIVDL